MHFSTLNGKKSTFIVPTDNCSVISKKRVFVLSIFFILLLAPKVKAQIRIDRYLEQGRIELQNKDYHQAIKTFSRIILQDPSTFDAWYLRGLSKFYLNDQTGALRDLSRAIELNPAVSSFYLLRGILRDLQGDYYKALEDFTAGLSIDPTNAMLYYSRGTNRLRLNNFSNAIEDFDQAIKLNKNLEEAFINRGLAKARMFDKEGAFADFNHAIQLNPFSPEGHSRKGLLYYDNDQYQEALSSFNEAIYRDSANPQQYYFRALVWYELEHKDSCLSDLDKVCQLDPKHSLSFYNRAVIRSQLGDYEGAIDDYEQVNKIQPYHVLSYFNRGLLRFEINDLYGALVDFDRAISIYPDFAKAYLARASVKTKLGDQVGAQTDQYLANEKIQMNAGKSEEELSVNFADTTLQFEQLITLNSKFSASFSMTYQDELSLNELLGPEKLTKSGIILLNTREDLESQKSFSLTQNSKPLLLSLEADTLIGVALNREQDSLFNEGILILDEILWDKPQNVSALFVRAQLRLSMINFVKSTVLMNEIVPMQLLGSPVNGQVNTSDQIDYSLVREDLDRIISIAPELAVAWMNRGIVRAYAKDFQGAILDFRQAIVLIPDYAEAWYNLGISMIKTGRKEDGCVGLSKAGELGLLKAYRAISIHCSTD